MRTNDNTKPVADAPWLEHYPADSSTPEKKRLDTLPFTIGRNESTDLPINSSRVSREHVTIERDESGYRLRDLGSTNGTFLNGNRIAEAQLRDGDILVVADVEFSFYDGSRKRSRTTATQLMPASDDSADEDRDSVEFILGIRRLHEQLANRSFKIRFQPIVRLQDDETAGYEAIAASDAFNARQIQTERRIRSIECRLCERLLDVQRLVAAEQAARLPGSVAVFLGIEPSEVGGARFAESLLRLLAAAEGKSLVLQIPDSAVCDIPSFRDFLTLVGDFGLRTAYDGFAGGRVQAIGPDEVSPHYVKLAHSLVRGIDRHTNRQNQLQRLARQCNDIGCGIIATGVQNQLEAEACRDAGCTYAQGEFFGAACGIEMFRSERSVALV